MLQQRKKDYLQRLIEEFFKRLQQVIDENKLLTDAERKSVLDECFEFFHTNFEVTQNNEVHLLMEKINDNDLLEQYAKLLMIEYDITNQKDRGNLVKALDIIEYIQNTDTTYSWERTVLREDLLHRLDEGI
ncbi:MAG: hypothetical protein ACK5KL_05680 [Dysgonomonas sp.]